MIKLISVFEADKAINFMLHMRRLQFYSVKQLEEVYMFEKQRVLLSYSEIEKVYNVEKLNFAHKFNYNCQYLEGERFHNRAPSKEELISIIVLFFRTKYLIDYYLFEIQNNEI